MAANFDAFESGLTSRLTTIFSAGGDGITPASRAGEIAGAVRAELEAWMATVTVNAGIPVSTTGSPTAQTGATTAPGTLS